MLSTTGVRSEFPQRVAIREAKSEERSSCRRIDHVAAEEDARVPKVTKIEPSDLPPVNDVEAVHGAWGESADE